MGKSSVELLASGRVQRSDRDSVSLVATILGGFVAHYFAFPRALFV